MKKSALEELRELVQETARLLKEAEGAEHRRLREVLEGLADGSGFTDEAGDLDGNYPDVYRVGDTYRHVLWVADAKDAANQRLSDSREQIRGYMQSIHRRLATWRGAIILIATNDPACAHEWQNGLEELTREIGLRSAGARLIECDSRTFVATIAVRR